MYIYPTIYTDNNFLFTLIKNMLEELLPLQQSSVLDSPHHYEFIVDELCREVVLRELDGNLATFHGDRGLEVKREKASHPHSMC